MRDTTSPVTIPRPLVEELWSFIKNERDKANCDYHEHRADKLSALLQRMKAAGMADHLPTLKEVQDAWAAS